MTMNPRDIDVLETAKERGEAWRELMGHRAYLTLGTDLLYQMLNVPEDVAVTGISANPQSHAIEVYLASPRFPRLEDGMMARNLGMEMRVEYMTNDGGEVWMRLVVPGLEGLGTTSSAEEASAG